MEKNRQPLIYYEEEGVAYLEINRPSKKNAINAECWKGFENHFQRLGSRSDIQALIITGSSEGIFSAGVDVHPSDPLISEIFQSLQDKDKHKIIEKVGYMQDIINKLAHLPFPTISAINGICYSGGFELALACDIRIVIEDAILCFQETRLGLIPDLGGTVRLTRLVGPGTAKELIFSARKITPKEAYSIGLVNHVFPKSDFMHQVKNYARQIAANGPHAMKSVKAIIDAAMDLKEMDALIVEREHAADNILSGQCIEGISAFLEKRKPEWRE